jgi:predicted acetyltransferase
MGLDNLLLTCDADNTGSRRAIERNGGVLENEVDGLRRYWVGTSGRS